MSPACLQHHISSAIVTTRLEDMAAIARELEAIEGTEVHAQERGRIIVVMEGGSLKELSDRLNDIAAMPGVISANLVFEHSETEGEELCRLT